MRKLAFARNNNAALSPSQDCKFSYPFYPVRGGIYLKFLSKYSLALYKEPRCKISGFLVQWFGLCVVLWVLSQSVTFLFYIYRFIV